MQIMVKILLGTLEAGVVSPCASTIFDPGLDEGTLNLAEKFPDASALTVPGEVPGDVVPKGVNTTLTPSKVMVMLFSFAANPVPVTVTQVPDGPAIGKMLMSGEGGGGGGVQSPTGISGPVPPREVVSVPSSAVIV